MRTSSKGRRALLLGFGVLLTALGATQVAAGRRVATQQAQQLPMAMVESVLSQTPTVSADGRWVVYAGVRELQAVDSANSVSPVTEENTIWLKDRADDSLIDLTPYRDDIRSGRTVWPVISGDGCTVTVVTELALDLFRDDDTGSRWDVYRVLLPHCGDAGSDSDSDSDSGSDSTPSSAAYADWEADWELVSATNGSGFDITAGDDASPLYPPAVAADGNLVAYTRKFGVTTAEEVLGITVVDLTIAIGEPGRAMPVAGTPASGPDSTFRYLGQREPTISADGKVLAFTSDAISDATVPEWGVGLVEGGFATSHVYVWDRTPPELEQDLDSGLDSLAADVVPALETLANEPGTVTAISTVATGATGDSTSPALSGNGRFVAFVSTASNLIPGATLPPCAEVCLPQVYLFDRSNSSLHLASRAPGDPTSPPIAADAGATQPSLNYGGEELLFVSRSNNLFPTRSLGVGDATDGDIVLALPALGTLDRVSVLADGITPAPAANSHPRMSAVGRVVVFDTLAGAVYGTPEAGRETGRQVAIVAHEPALTLSDLDFGTVAVWFPGPEWFLVLSNDGPASFLPVKVEVDNEDFLVSGGTCLAVAAAVPPGATCTIELMLLPTTAGEINGTLTVSEEGFGAVSVTAQLTGRGGEPSLAPTPAGGYADSTLVGTSAAPMSFSVGNVSFGSVRVKSVAVEGSHPEDFHVSVDECTGSTLGAGATDCELQVVFTPTAGGRRSAQVVVVSRDGGYATMLLSGDAFYDPKLSVVAASGTTATSTPNTSTPNTATPVTATIVAGSRLTVVGSGFAPNTNVAISWADGSGGSITAVTDAAGGLNAQVVVRATDRTGVRTIVAQTVDQVASAEVLILAPGSTHGPNSPAWPRP